MKSDFLLAFNEIADARKLPREIILDALRAALISAYRRNAGIGSGQHVEARIDDRNGTLAIWVEKEVVEGVENPLTEVEVEDARLITPEAVPGDMVIVESTPQDFGRIAAQTAKQVILQRMREAERDAQYQEFQDRIGDLVTGTIQSDSSGVVTLGLGRTEAILPHSQQVPGERYKVHDKVRAYVMDVRKSSRGPQIVVSRTHRNMLRRLLEYEVPEIYNGTVEIKSIAREPGARSKVAVAALQEGADPVGACVGMRGVRIQSIVKELNNEKIDVIEWSGDQKVFIAKALSPARVSGVFLDDDPDSGRTAIVVVPEDQLSLAIGREGQNARLAAKLTGWRIDIKSVTEASQEAINHLNDPSMDAVRENLAASHEQVLLVLEKKATNRVISPEEYSGLVEFINSVETQWLNARETGRAERRAQREAARALVPPPAFQYMLEDTILPARIYNHLAEAGFSTVGQVMEQYNLEPRQFVTMSGVGQQGLEAIEKMIASIDFTPAPVEEVIEEAAPEATEPVDGAEPPTEVSAEDVQPVSEAGDTETEVDEDFARAQRAALVAELTGVTPLSPEKQLEEDLSREAAIEKKFGRKLDEIDEDDPFAFEGLSSDEIEELKKAKAKQRRRQLVFDEDLGQVVSKRRRKAGRSRGKWEEFDGEEE